MVIYIQDTNYFIGGIIINTQNGVSTKRPITKRPITKHTMHVICIQHMYFDTLCNKTPITKRPITKRPTQQNPQLQNPQCYKTPNATKRPITKRQITKLWSLALRLEVQIHFKTWRSVQVTSLRAMKINIFTSIWKF